MRPQRLAVSRWRWVATVAVVVTATLAVVVLSLGMIPRVQRVQFPHLLKGRDLRTDGPTDLRTDRPSHRDARTHLKMKHR